jgi:hypothetical protein
LEKIGKRLELLLVFALLFIFWLGYNENTRK